MQKGDSHYHCFGCGAHGDAIAFLMSHVKMSFVQAVESLAERFQVSLEKADEPLAERGPSKPQLKNVLEHAATIYHYLLLHSAEGHVALKYLYKRGLSLEFIRQFQVGFAPKQGDVLMRYLSEQGVDEKIQEQAGLVMVTQQARRRDFFSDRIRFPSATRWGQSSVFPLANLKKKLLVENTSIPLKRPSFKKSRILFGLSYCRKESLKETRAIIVEGQIDALRLIHAGFNYAVAGQGTAFGEEHVRELLHLGVNRVYLALDADEAGLAAAVKIGHLFQKKGIEVLVVSLPEIRDPDSLLIRRRTRFFAALLKSKP